MNNLMPITYNNERILTTKQLAQIYETDIDSIKHNFNNNVKHFEEGTHYYLLKGNALKEFKNKVNDIPLVGKNANQLYLWTERGADRHCKILDTDKAWEQFDNLEDTYFRVKEEKQFINTQSFNLSQQIPALNTMNVVKFIADDLRVSKVSRIKMYRQACEDEGIKSNFLPTYTDEEVAKSATTLLKKFNIPMTAKKFNKLMIENGLMVEESRGNSKGGTKKYKSLTNAGLKYGINKVSSYGTEKETNALYHESTFMELINFLDYSEGVM